MKTVRGGQGLGQMCLFVQSLCVFFLHTELTFLCWKKWGRVTFKYVYWCVCICVCEGMFVVIAVRYKTVIPSLFPSPFSSLGIQYLLTKQILGNWITSAMELSSKSFPCDTVASADQRFRGSVWVRYSHWTRVNVQWVGSEIKALSNSTWGSTVCKLIYKAMKCITDLVYAASTGSNIGQQTTRWPPEHRLNLVRKVKDPCGLCRCSGWPACV